LEFGKVIHEAEEELSDYAKTRLLIARMRALQKYQEKWG
jgi:hypothetical protein